MSVRRDPETGQFVSGGKSDFRRFEQWHHMDTLSVPAADLDGTTNQLFGEDSEYEGREIIDFETILDRDEVGILQWVGHQIVVYGLSTSTADGTVRGALELSFSPSASAVSQVFGSTDLADQTADEFSIEGPDEANIVVDDTGDIVGRMLQAVGFSPFSNTTDGVGGSGGAGIDQWEGPVLIDPVVDDRDQLFHNGVMEAQNVSDASVHMDYTTWGVLGVMQQ